MKISRLKYFCDFRKSSSSANREKSSAFRQEDHLQHGFYFLKQPTVCNISILASLSLAENKQKMVLIGTVLQLTQFYQEAFGFQTETLGKSGRMIKM